MSITCKDNTQQHGGDPPRESYNFSEKAKSEFKKENPKCQVCKKHNTEEIGHILSGDPKGPRYDETKTLFHIKSKKNMIAVCKKCHKKIDKNVNEYTVQKLNNSKK